MEMNSEAGGYKLGRNLPLVLGCRVGVRVRQACCQPRTNETLYYPEEPMNTD